MTSASQLLVARETALVQLREALQHAGQGRGRLVLVSGEAGIGKSALADALTREAEAAGAEVVLGRAWEFGEAPPYFPFRASFAALGLQAETVAAAASAFRVWEAVLAALARAASSKTWVLVFEDIHAADLATLDLLVLLAQPLRMLRVLVLATARLDDPRVDARSAQRLTRLGRDGDDLRLEPLNDSEVQVLAERAHGRRLSVGVLAELVRRTRGNPLFVIECARALRNSPQATEQLPATIRHVVLERVQLLPAATQAALGALSILGREASAASIGKLRGQLPAQVIEALEPARRAGVIDESQPGTFVFTHILVRDAIEDALGVNERTALHAAASAALQAQGNAADVVVERARHALSAFSSDAASLELGLQAAQLLEQQGAFDRAHAMVQRVEAARRAGGLPQATPLERLHRARIAHSAGHYSVSRTICLKVASEAQEQGDAELLAHAALILGTDLRPGIVDQQLVQLLERARELGAGQGSSLEARVLARLAAALQPALDPQIPVLMARQAIALAERVCDEASAIDVLLLAGAALIDYGTSAENVALNQRLAERSERAGDLGSAARAHARLALSHLEAGEFADWDAAVTRSIELAERLPAPRLRWRPLLLQSMRALARGDVATSDSCIREAEQLHAVSDDPALTLSLSAHRLASARQLHRDAELLAMAADVSRLPTGVVARDTIASLVRAASFTRIEDKARASAELRGLGATARALEEGLFLAFLAEATAFAGSVEQCRRLRALYVESSTQQISSGHVQMSYEGPVLRPIALLDAALGDFAAAERHLRAALSTVSEQGFKSWMAQLDYDLAVLLQRLGREREALTLLDAALELARELPMPGLAERAMKRARVLGAMPPAAPLSERPLPTSYRMTREGDVWSLSFKGRSFRLKDSRGLQLLARLVEHSGEEIHVLALASDDAGSSLHDTSQGELLDARAKHEYKERTLELRQELAEAERNNDVGQLERLTREQALLESELARALGLGGKARGSGSPSERARVNVQRRLKDAIARVAEADAECGQFLERYVRTGNYCVFLGGLG